MTTPSAPEPSPAPENAATGQQEAKAGPLDIVDIPAEPLTDLERAAWLVQRLSHNSGEPCDGPRFREGIHMIRAALLARQPAACVGRCRDCRWWSPWADHKPGWCTSNEMAVSIPNLVMRGITNPDFGCVHWEARG